MMEPAPSRPPIGGKHHVAADPLRRHEQRCEYLGDDSSREFSANFPQPPSIYRIPVLRWIGPWIIQERSCWLFKISWRIHARSWWLSRVSLGNRPGAIMAESNQTTVKIEKTVAHCRMLRNQTSKVAGALRFFQCSGQTSFGTPMGWRNTPCCSWSTS